ncbi:MAG: tRNA ((37)-N6)-threonylcarbamoyltransferase complex transferase subunit TsaD, partial [Actinomycetota bacterium]
FQEAVADVLITKSLLACENYGIPRLLLGGGVAANSRVRGLAAERCARAGIDLRIPPLQLCTDNGAMIAALGAQRMMAGFPPSRMDSGVFSTLSPSVIQL